MIPKKIIFDDLDLLNLGGKRIGIRLNTSIGIIKDLLRGARVFGKVFVFENVVIIAKESVLFEFESFYLRWGPENDV